ncbi:hypothetical protein [Tessaracoccus antarcticus]|uniref:hypothetical protein n=1 Tax=Tessaracoccus antarcticus TaxID=2479848 RepID=UPI0011C4588B|nr:hypothetical protein [Tessaracoccus antarcticus]
MLRKLIAGAAIAVLSTSALPAGAAADICVPTAEWGCHGGPMIIVDANGDGVVNVNGVDREDYPKLPANFDVYTTEGIHYFNGNFWWTECEAYSSVVDRCRTHYAPGNGNADFTFNNLTYLPSPRSLWTKNPLGVTGSWTANDGGRWRTECDTALTGRNGCRTWRNGVFNNIVRFS